MAEGDDKPTILPEFVADVLRAVHRLHPVVEKISAVRQREPEIARAGLDFLHRQRPLVAAADHEMLATRAKITTLRSGVGER